MKITIGKKITLGFAALLAILVLTGGFSVLKMREASRGAHVLSTEYVPESDVATKLQTAFFLARFNVRTFMYTAAPADLERAQKYIVMVKSAIKDAEALAARSTVLVKLKDQIKTASELTAAYENAVDETAKTTTELIQSRTAAWQNADEANTSLETLIQRQAARLEKEIQDKAGPEKQSERLLKIGYYNEIRSLLGAIRIANNRSEILRDTKIIEAELSRFTRAYEVIATLKPLLKAADDQNDLAALQGDLKSLQSALEAAIAKRHLMDEVNLRRNKAADRLAAFVDEISSAADAGTQRIAAETSAGLGRASSVMVASLAVSLLIGVVCALLVTRMITRPITAASDLVDRVAKRDLTARLESKSTDEIGQMVRQVNAMVEGLRGNIQSIADGAQSLAGASTELSAVSGQVSSNAEETSAQANVVSSAAEQVSRNIQTVATSAEEMTATVSEIAKNTAQASKVASHASKVAERTNATVAKLGDSSAEIGEVVNVITSIAEQTNLLALNATIEAARAGEAGKGFAVVANEVKELAKQTAKATEEIKGKINAIRSDTKGVVDAIGEINTIITQINEIQTVIASAVEEQSATTSEISRNASEASAGSAEIAKNIAGVSQAARSTTEGSTQTASAAQELARLSADLKRVVDQFKLTDHSTPPPPPAAKAAPIGALIAQPA